ncbi:hypothetical protein BFJ68_g16184 [Fusarium oxysporum]|uniref:Hemerythrin-like domain-containing protein n=1 Tax=Fusarium oxysporum TaxID=5507 RepID=A0A420PG69_FUSOX|nr:hypothetical protein BFJ71_g16353 [Fusarium oxysporum]RKK91527.1 hypothetical protein BFJ68_g16184 [Fusarium oxysporum]
MRIQTAALSSAISDAIIQDHHELERYYNEVINSTNYDHQQRLGNQFVWELARHSIGEELVVYPAFEKYMGPKGQEMADSNRQKHHKVKGLLKEFQNMKSTDPDYVPKLKELWAPLWQHIQEGEKLDLPALEQSLKAQGDETEFLARRFAHTAPISLSFSNLIRSARGGQTSTDKALHHLLLSSKFYFHGSLVCDTVDRDQ